MGDLDVHVESNPDTAYERSDWPLGTVGLILVGTFLFLVIATLALIGAFPRAVSDVGRALTIEPPAPRLETNPPADLAQFRAEEDKRLNSYYWVDKQKGVIHIPIDQAMKEVAKKGIDGFPQGEP